MAQPKPQAAAAFYAHPPPLFAQPVTNNANLLDLSRMGDVAAAGSAPIGPGRFVPGVPPAQNRIPNPAQAAAQQQHQLQQQAPPQAAQPLVPQPRPAGAPLLGPTPNQPLPPQQPARAQQGVPPSVPPTSSAECRTRNYENYSGPVYQASDSAIEEFRKNVRGDVKTRIYSFDKSFVPMNTDEKEIVLKIDREEQREILRYRHSRSGGKRDGDLGRVVLLEVRLLQLHLDIKTPVSFNMTGAKGRDYSVSTGCRALVNASAAGGRYSESHHPGRTISRYFPNVNAAALLRYGKLRNSDLRKDITPLPGKGWSLVPVNSPIVEVIQASQDGLRMKLDDVHIIDDVVPVADQLIGAVVDFLQEHIAQFPGHDCTEFTLTATRASGDTYSQTGDLVGHNDEAVKYQLKEACGFHLKVEMIYSILSNTEACREELTNTAPSAGKPLGMAAIAGKAPGTPGQSF